MSTINLIYQFILLRKKLEINTGSLEVLASGTLSSNFGHRGFENKATQYPIKFEYAGGHFKLREFYQVHDKEMSQ